jgi:hypothetical protein
MALYRVMEMCISAPMDRDCDYVIEGVLSLTSHLLCVPKDDLFADWTILIARQPVFLYQT